MSSLLKFITCGSVDDGKSTLIGHMLYDAKLIFTDQKNALKLASKVGNCNEKIDYSLLLDGLMAEREQGITIDVAYRYFNTEKRSFIVADTPGHEEYTRNMAVGASFAELAIILIDASKGILPQTRRHTLICNMMGINHLVFAINKIDLIRYNKNKFNDIVGQIEIMTQNLEFRGNYAVIPVSATDGDNITKLSNNTNWYTGKPLLKYLEEVEILPQEVKNSFVMPVQRVSRPNSDFRGFQGQVVQGSISIGENITILPSGETAKVKELLQCDKKIDKIYMGQATTISLDKEVDCSRGCVITKTEEDLQTSRLLIANILWTDDEQLIIGRNYLMKIGTKIIPATIIKIRFRLDIDTGKHLHTVRGNKNDILNCEVALSEKVVLDKFNNCKEMGRFILINRVNNMTSACGVVKSITDRSDNLIWQNMDITREMRANQKNQTPKTIWFTGLSGSGKSTIANILEKELVSMGKHTMLLDGDNIRLGLNNDLAFGETSRVENIRRIAEVSKLMNDAGLIVLVSAISPFAKDRKNAREIIGEDFFEIYVKASLEVCEKRDVKGLYKKARDGKIQNFTGISSPYEVPENVEFIADTESNDVDDIVKRILKFLDL